MYAPVSNRSVVTWPAVPLAAIVIGLVIEPSSVIVSPGLICAVPAPQLADVLSQVTAYALAALVPFAEPAPDCEIKTDLADRLATRKSDTIQGINRAVLIERGFTENDRVATYKVRSSTSFGYRANWRIEVLQIAIIVARYRGAVVGGLGV